MDGKYQRGCPGITLVEVLLALAVLALVLTTIYAFFHFGVLSFSRGETQTLLQQHVRLATVAITQNIRYAKTLEINTKCPLSLSGGEICIWFQGDTILYWEDTLDPVSIIQGLANEGIDFSQSYFAKESNNRIKFTITGAKGNQSYTLETSLTLINFSSTGEIGGLNNGKAIVFKKP